MESARAELFGEKKVPKAARFFPDYEFSTNYSTSHPGQLVKYGYLSLAVSGVMLRTDDDG
jgi:hypothetical protein